MCDESNINEELAKDMNTRGCPVCNRVWHEVTSFFSSWVYSLANDENIQKENANSLGLCHFHTWQFVSMGSPQGISSGYENLVRHLSDELYRLSSSIENVLDKLSNLIIDSKGCRVCSLTRNMENRYIKKLAIFLIREDNKNLYLTSEGVCLRHLGMLMVISSADMKKFLLNHPGSRFRQWAENMNQYVFKTKSLQRHLCSQDENCAYFTALTHIAGIKHIRF
ncbi:MAG: hypothetical protein JW976_14565 [Syntrophaceae bacterium]|nr:hypothetical protein [Syntrophaceae bacterium]